MRCRSFRGIDGVILVWLHRSTFLPQVWEDFSDPRVFIGHLKHKAGLPPDFWDPGVRLSPCSYTP